MNERLRTFTFSYDTAKRSNLYYQTMAMCYSDAIKALKHHDRLAKTWRLI